MATARVAEVRSYSLIEELLSTQGWDLRRPPQGDVLAQHEYKDYESLKDALKVAGRRSRWPRVCLNTFSSNAKRSSLSRCLKLRHTLLICPLLFVTLRLTATHSVMQVFRFLPLRLREQKMTDSESG